MSLYRAVGKDIRKELHGDMVGSAPPDLDMVIIPFSAFAVIRTTLPVARGEISRQAYLERSGHHGPHEMELGSAGPEKDPDWLVDGGHGIVEIL